MFTGVIEEIGQVAEIKFYSHGATLKVLCEKVLDGVKLGDSISINGACQTVVEFDSKSFAVNISDETLRVTNLKDLKAGDLVNLECAMKMSERLHGHIVSGHVEFTSKFIKKDKLGEFYNMEFEVLPEYRKYMVKKGSVTVNGISLTIADLSEKTFVCAIIPHTFENTNLKELKNNDIVNIETDIIAKYVENFVEKDTKSTITTSFLAENGFM